MNPCTMNAVFRIWLACCPERELDFWTNLASAFASPRATMIPHFLAPRSPKPGYDSALVDRLERRYSQLDHARRTTGSLAHDDL